jgi:hypothetical protein
MKREEQMVFAVSPHDDGQVDVLLGMPTAAWEYMKDGKTHTFDLTKLGLPIRLILYGAPDHATALGYIQKHNKSLGLETLDLRDEDFSV